MADAELTGWLQWVEQAHPQEVALGLERVASVAATLGRTELPVPVVTVAGTNGKGSTVAYLEGALTEAGQRVGAFTSPHFFRFNERARLGGEPLGDPPLVTALAAVEEARGETPLTYFEHTTLAVVEALIRSGAELLLLEVGLGGRLDAVNIWDPSVAVITSIGRDHEAFLGSDREAIGAEKAGIFRAGVPAVCGDPDPPASLVTAGGKDLHLLGRDFWPEAVGAGQWRLAGPSEAAALLPRPAMEGAFQQRNAATAVMAGLCLPEPCRPHLEDWAATLPQVQVPGRGQCLGGAVPIWVDVAHNPHAAAELAQALETTPVVGRTLAVWAMLAEKDAEGVARAMTGAVDQWYPSRSEGPRPAWESQALARILGEAGARVATEAPSVTDGLARARQDARSDGDRIVVFGSFFTVAEALQELDARRPL